ncbi:MAG: integrin [Kofleriaceae bacterium]
MIWIVLAVTACGFPRPEHVVLVGGNLRGLWSGTDGVALRLAADGHDDLLTVGVDGEFRFTEPLAEGTPYVVTVAASPNRHMCAIDFGSSGIAANVDITNISVTCTGPEIRIGLSGQSGWVFDPLREVQAFAASVIAQAVSLKISGDSLMAITVDGAAAIADEVTAPIPLPLGSSTVEITLLASGGLSKSYRLEFQRSLKLIEQVAYGKASNTDPSDFFGTAVAISGDTLAVGAREESSGSFGINSAQTDNARASSGSVYVFTRSAGTWTQQAYIKASNPGAEDRFGSTVSLSGDTLAVSSPGEDSGAVRVGGNQSDESAPNSGAVYIFTRSGTTWTQQAYIKATTSQIGGALGRSLSLSGDELAVTANQVDEQTGISEAIDIFGRSGTTWTFKAQLTAPLPQPDNPTIGSVLLPNVALSNDTLAISSAESDLQGHQGRGGIYIFVRSGMTWARQAYLTVSDMGIEDQFATSFALSGDTLAVGAPLLFQGDTSGAPASFVHVYRRTGTTWSKEASLTGSNTTAADQFASSVAVLGDTIVVGAPRESSNAMGAEGNQHDTSALNAGAAYVFARQGTTWTEKSYLKASNTELGDRFGEVVAISGDTLVVGASGEDSNAKGINPPNGQADNSDPVAGAIYIFR